MSDNLWINGGNDLHHVPSSRRRRQQRVNTDGARLFGFPLWWFRLVYPAVRGKGELAVALYLYRLRVVQRSHTVRLSNERLSAELGIDRFAKYRALRQLAAAKIIRVKRRNGQALVVELSRKPKAR